MDLNQIRLLSLASGADHEKSGGGKIINVASMLSFQAVLVPKITRRPKPASPG
jgi:hypothetical protein